jgi:DNA-binding NarL/FixJ family response regulator
VVEAPAGWVSLENDCGFVSATPVPGVFTAGLSAWIVGQVPTNPCQNHVTLTASGETVDEPPTTRTARQVDVLAAFVASGGSVPDAAARVGIRPSTAKRHLADLRARSGLTTEQLIYRGRAEGWLVVPSLEPA